MPPETPEVGLRALLFGRRSNRNDLILPGIHRRPDPPNGAALAGGIRPFKDQHQRTLADKPWIANQFGEPRLILGQIALVILLGQRLRQIQFAEHIFLVDRMHNRWRHGHLLTRLLLQAALNCVEHDATDRQGTVFIIRPFNNDPRRVRRIGHTQDMPRHFLQLAVGFQAIVAFLGHPPGGMRIFLQRFQPLLLTILGKMEPEFEDQRTFIDQHGLETIDVIQALVHFGAAHISGNPVGNRLRIPGSGKNSDLPLRRQGAPISPHIRTRTLLITGRRKSQRRNMPRIHPGVKQIDRFALAATVDPTNQDNDRELLFLQHLVLRIKQGGAQLRHLFLESFLVNLVAKLC